MTSHMKYLSKRPGERPARWTAELEEQLETALEDGRERSFRRWQGRTYGVLA